MRFCKTHKMLIDYAENVKYDDLTTKVSALSRKLQVELLQAKELTLNLQPGNMMKLFAPGKRAGMGMRQRLCQKVSRTASWMCQAMQIFYAHWLLYLLGFLEV